LTSIVLTGAYTGSLFTQKLLSSNVPFTDFESFLKCLEGNRCKLIVPSRTHGPLIFITQPGSDLSTRVNKILDSNRPQYASTSEIFEKIKNDKKTFYVYIGVDEGARLYIKGQQCSYYVVRTAFQQPAGLVIRKNLTILNEINKVALYFQ